MKRILVIIIFMGIYGFVNRHGGTHNCTQNLIQNELQQENIIAVLEEQEEKAVEIVEIENEKQEEVAQVEEIVEEEKQEIVQASSKQVVATPKTETKQIETPIVEEQKQEIIETPKQKETSQVSNTPQVVEEKPKEESFKCTSTKHFTGAGNTGKWFKTKQEGIAYYEKVLAEWDNKVQSKAVTYQEYLDKCPYNYEMWTCPMCDEWTIHFNYR